MNKTEAAQSLGISVRTLETHMAEKRIPYGHVKGKTRPVVDFTPEDVEAFRATLAPTFAIPATNSANRSAANLANTASNLANNPATNSANLAKSSSFLVPESRNSLARLEQGSVAENSELFLATLLKATANAPLRPADLAAKSLLTIAEVQTLTGLSENQVRDAIKEEQLLARKIGKAWRVRPQDVQAWVDSKFN